MLHERAQITARKALAAAPKGTDVAQWVFENWEDLIKLDSVARDQVDPSRRIDMLDAPISVGGLRFWRLSPAAMEVAFGSVVDWFESDPQTCFYGILYCMAHSRDRAGLARLSSPVRARRVLRMWTATLNSSPEALQVVMETLLPKPVSPDESTATTADAGDCLGRMTAILCREYGKDPDYWLYECSMDRIDALLSEYAFCSEEELRTRAALAGVKTMNFDGPEAAVATRFLRAARAFYKKHQVPESEQ